MTAEPRHIQIEDDEINAVVAFVQEGDRVKGVAHGHDIMPH